VSGWIGRLRQIGGEAHDLHEAADLVERRHTGRPGSVFSKVTDCALIGSVALSGLAAAVHLKKEIFPKGRDGPQERSTEHGHHREAAGGENALQHGHSR
jgi:hypothetical protein